MCVCVCVFVFVCVSLSVCVLYMGLWLYRGLEKLALKKSLNRDIHEYKEEDMRWDEVGGFVL